MSEGHFILLAGVLLAAALSASVFAARLRLPALLLVLVVGMAAGSDGAGWLAFDDHELARRIGTVALALILFDGGLTSGWRKIRPVFRPALRLAVVGTILTALVAGLAASALFGLSALEGLMVGSILASTDTAAVFSLIRGSTLTRRVASTLEGEAGLNDPVAILLVIGFIDWIQHRGYSLVDMSVLFGKELLIGSVCGLFAGAFGAAALSRARLPAAGLYPVASFAIAALAFGSADSLHGSGFLAVYVAGLVLSDAAIPGRQTISIFHDGLAWVAQVTLFLTLGLLVFPGQLGGALGGGLLLWLVVTFVARPLAVVVCTAFDRFDLEERVVLGAAGMRGGVAILLATYPVTSGVDGSLELFNVIFIAVVLSTLVQGPTFEPLARWLGVTASEPALPRPLAEFGTIRGLGAEVLEYQVAPADGIVGRRVSELNLPNEVTLTVIVRRDEAVPPRASTRIAAGDTLHLVAREEVAPQLRFLFGEWQEPDWMPHSDEGPATAEKLVTEPWQEHDGDPSDPDLIDGTQVIELLRTRPDAAGALVVLEDGRYAVTGTSTAVGSADAVGRYARRRRGGAASDTEELWWHDVAAALRR
jgi:cell volume regulation protein A